MHVGHEGMGRRLSDDFWQAEPDENESVANGTNASTSSGQPNSSEIGVTIDEEKQELYNNNTRVYDPEQVPQINDFMKSMANTKAMYEGRWYMIQDKE